MLVRQKKSFAEDELTQNLRGSGKEVRIRRQLRPLVWSPDLVFTLEKTQQKLHGKR